MTRTTEATQDKKFGGQETGRRITCTVAICALLALLCLMFFQIEQHRADLYELASKGDFALTRILSSQVSGGVKWKKATFIEEYVKNIADENGSTLASLAAYSTTGEMVSHYSKNHHVIFSTTKDKKGEVVGYISTAWNTNPEARYR